MNLLVLADDDGVRHDLIAQPADLLVPSAMSPTSQSLKRQRRPNMAADLPSRATTAAAGRFRHPSLICILW